MKTKIKRDTELYCFDRKLYKNLSNFQFVILKTGFLCDFPLWNHPRGYNYYWHLYCNPGTAGSGIRSENSDFPLTDDRMILVPPFFNYSVYSRPPIRHFFVHFLPVGNILPIRRQPWYIPADVPAMQQMEKIIGEGPKSPRVLNLAFAMVQRALGLLPSEAFCMDKSELPDSRIEKAIQFYMDRERRRIKNTDIAAHFGMSVQNFERLFKSQTGMAPGEFHRQRKMQVCADWLQYTQKSIDDIAQEMGYADRFVFSKTFKKYYGTSPAAYRKQVLFSRERFFLKPNVSVRTTGLAQI